MSQFNHDDRQQASAPNAPAFGDGRTPPMTPALAHEIVEQLVAAGMSRERVEAGLLAHNVVAAPPPPTPAPLGPNANAQAGDFRPKYENDLRDAHPGDKFTTLDETLRGWAAAAQFSPELGTVLIEQMSAESTRVGKMDERDRTEWAIKEDERLAALARTPEALASIEADAEKALGTHPFGQELKGSIMWKSAWLRMTLANFYRSRG